MVFPAAHRFMEMFCSLRNEHSPSIMLNGTEMFCWTAFNPMRVYVERDAEVAAHCAEVAGETLCPLGTDGFHLTIYMSLSGRIFAGENASVFRCSETVDKFFAKAKGLTVESDDELLAVANQLVDGSAG
ncbi:SUKH-3 domain-containing protein [Actinomadura nitritigenes]|uniref:SUKH-3 domain-containing protein n=1 Tax=Actinomadura nitritigenes TaxID=134602 RepID=UPI003D92DC82